MKIHGPQKPNFNPYKDQVEKKSNMKQDINKKDRLEISSQAKQLLETKQSNPERVKYVQAIKKEVESGTYEINHSETAKKMINFWSNK